MFKGRCFYFAVWILSLISLQGKREVFIVTKILSKFGHLLSADFSISFHGCCVGTDSLVELAAVFRLPRQVRSKTQATRAQFKADILAELIIRQKQNTSVVSQLLFFLITNTVHAQSMR